jgi:hypothetical protein
MLSLALALLPIQVPSTSPQVLGKPAGPAMPAPLVGERKQVLHLTTSLSARPWKIQAENTYGHIDSLPFDGFTYNLPLTWDLFKGEYGYFDELDVRQQLSGLDFSFQNVRHNYANVVIRRRSQYPGQGDFYDDLAWADTLQQLRVMARVLREPKYQCVGIFFDNEEYFEPVWNYPEDVTLAATHSLQAYQQKARERGRQWMQVLVEEWPNARVIAAHGPYVSAPEQDLPSADAVTMDQIADSGEYELFGPFFMGLLDGSSHVGQVIDGGEVYQLRSAAEFNFNYCWRKFTMAESISVPSELQGLRWVLPVGVAHGLYTDSWPDPIQDLMTPAIMQASLVAALKRADQLVWVYSESQQDFLKPGGIEPAWMQAIAAAKASADLGMAWPYAVPLPWSLTELLPWMGTVQSLPVTPALQRYFDCP